jgi:hypothetical protein
VGARLKEFYSTTLASPPEAVSTITQLALMWLGGCSEVNVINCDGSKNALVKRYIFHYWLCLLMACGI